MQMPGLRPGGSGSVVWVEWVGGYPEYRAGTGIF